MNISGWNKDYSNYNGWLYFSGVQRFTDNNSNFICPNVNDKFTTTNSTIGNKKLTRPIGLITADEVNMAGARTSYQNQLFYLYTGTYYWTMSPSIFHIWGDANEFLVNSSGELTNSSASSGYGVRPVINLDSSNLQVTGSGTKEDPYVIE